MLNEQLDSLEAESAELGKVILYILTETAELEKQKNTLQAELETETAKLDDIKSQEELDAATVKINSIQDQMDQLFKMQKELSDKAPELQTTQKSIEDLKKLVSS